MPIEIRNLLISLSVVFIFMLGLTLGVPELTFFNLILPAIGFVIASAVALVLIVFVFVWVEDLKGI